MEKICCYKNQKNGYYAYDQEDIKEFDKIGPFVSRLL